MKTYLEQVVADENVLDTLKAFPVVNITSIHTAEGGKVSQVEVTMLDGKNTVFRFAEDSEGLDKLGLGMFDLRTAVSKPTTTASPLEEKRPGIFA